MLNVFCEGIAVLKKHIETPDLTSSSNNDILYRSHIRSVITASVKELATYVEKIHKQHFGSIIERILVLSDDEIFTIDTHGNSKIPFYVSTEVLYFFNK